VLNYRRAWYPGGTYFFTVNLLQRQGNDLLVREIDLLRRVVRHVMAAHPFIIHGWVVLPDHLHCVIALPPGETDFSVRWRLIKMGFSKSLPVWEKRSLVRCRRGERGIWQRRYWEHLIRDEADYRAHMDYVHINPVKHGLVGRVMDWPFSTFHRLVAAGVYASDWAGGMESGVGELQD
jgi:putative transposase